jgi:hypothetical protein
LKGRHQKIAKNLYGMRWNHEDIQKHLNTVREDKLKTTIIVNFTTNTPETILKMTQKSIISHHSMMSFEPTLLKTDKQITIFALQP